MISAAGAALELVRVPDEALPPDLVEAGTLSQHLLASPQKARDVLGWHATASPQVLRRAVAWHLSHPPADAATDFSADDVGTSCGASDDTHHTSTGVARVCSAAGAGQPVCEYAA